MIPEEGFIYYREHSKKYDCKAVAYLDTIIATGYYHNNKSPSLRAVYHFSDGEKTLQCKFNGLSNLLPKGFPIPVLYQSGNPTKVCIDHDREIVFNDSLYVSVKRNIWQGDIIILKRNEQ